MGWRPNRPTRPDPASDGGFTLVEVVVAMVLLTACSLAAFTILLNGLKIVRGNSDRVQAASIARTELTRLRLLGAAAITPGLTLPTAYASTGFTVRTTANWVGVNQDSNPCESASGVSPAQSYMGVHIEVTGGELAAPQVLDAVVPPTDDVPAIKSGSITVLVRDHQSTPQPISGATVSVTSSATGATNQSAVTGYDGCVYFANLVPGTWTATLTLPSGYLVKPGTQSVVTASNLAAGQNVPVAYYYAQGTGITFAAGGPKYAIPAGIPFAGSFGSWTGTVPATMPVAGFTLPGSGALMWPEPAGFTGRLGCVDAGTATVYPVQPGQTTQATLPTTAVEIVGPADQAVTISHASETGGSPCAGGLSLPGGTLAVPPDPTQPDAAPGPLGRATVAIPRGTWTFAVPGKPDKTVTFSATTTSPCSVAWASDPTPAPTATATPAPSPTPTPRATLAPIAPENPPCA